MFVEVFILTAVLVAFLPPALRPTVTVGPFFTNNPVGLVLGMAAATGSFKATLRRARAQSRAG